MHQPHRLYHPLPSDHAGDLRLPATSQETDMATICPRLADPDNQNPDKAIGELLRLLDSVSNNGRRDFLSSIRNIGGEQFDQLISSLGTCLANDEKLIHSNFNNFLKNDFRARIFLQAFRISLERQNEGITSDPLITKFCEACRNSKLSDDTRLQLALLLIDPFTERLTRRSFLSTSSDPDSSSAYLATHRPVTDSLTFEPDAQRWASLFSPLIGVKQNVSTLEGYLAALGPFAVSHWDKIEPYLLESLKSEDEGEQFAALLLFTEVTTGPYYLEEIDKRLSLEKRAELAEKLIDSTSWFLNSPESERCIVALSMLGNLGSNAEGIIQDAIRLMDHEDPNVRDSAARACGLIGGEEAARVLVQEWDLKQREDSFLPPSTVFEPPKEWHPGREDEEDLDSPTDIEEEDQEEISRNALIFALAAVADVSPDAREILHEELHNQEGATAIKEVLKVIRLNGSSEQSGWKDNVKLIRSFFDPGNIPFGMKMTDPGHPLNSLHLLRLRGGDAQAILGGGMLDYITDHLYQSIDSQTDGKEVVRLQRCIKACTRLERILTDKLPGLYRA